MSLSSEIEKNSIEDDCVDSGAETMGSDSSPRPTGSYEHSMAEMQDPFLVIVHIIADPGQARPLQHATDALLSRIHLELRLFRVSERGSRQPRPKPLPPARSTPSVLQRALPAQPALAVVLFLQEEYEGEEHVLHTLHRPPWRYHHTALVSARCLAPTLGEQDFFTLAPGTPLWAVRPVHCGKEVVRFTVYSRFQSFGDMVRMYGLLLSRPPAQRADDFCLFQVFSNADVEVQLSVRRLLLGQSPVPAESAVVEFRVRDLGALVPLLPHPCSPISEVRWQTEDYDGNKILLQVRGSAQCRRRHTIGRLNDLLEKSLVAPLPFPPDPALAPPCGCGLTSSRNRRQTRSFSSCRQQNLTRLSQPDLPLACRMDRAGQRTNPQVSRASCWSGARTRSLFCLPTLTSPAPNPAPSSRPVLPRRPSLHAPPFRLNVNALVGAVETDVDTGLKLDGRAVDLSVVSAYSPHPSCMPPQANTAVPRDGRLKPSAPPRPCPDTVCTLRNMCKGANDNSWVEEGDGFLDTRVEEELEFYI